MGFLSSLLGGGAPAMATMPNPASMSESVMGFPSVGMKQAAPPQPVKKPFAQSTFGNVLGMLGDALLAANGRAPMYGPRMQQQQEEARQQQANAALGNYLGNLDPGLRDLIMQAGAGPAMQAYGIAHPKANDAPAFKRELDAFGFDPEEQKGIARRRYTRPIIVGSPSTGYGVLDDGEAGDEGQAGSEPTVTDQEGYDALPPGAYYLDAQGNRRQKSGGPTETPSAPFP